MRLSQTAGKFWMENGVNTARAGPVRFDERKVLKSGGTLGLQIAFFGLLFLL
jgi:hypothetical protein|tara:strand:+ start:916 stop:1071 length:156 start_codon:yes stop_codon:yes gene_type:complete